jgi:hypothetical protein
MKLFFRFSALLMLLMLSFACNKNEDNGSIAKTPRDYKDALFVREWFSLECRIVKETPGFFPPQAARAFGYTGVALYESIAQGWPGAPRLAGQLNGFAANAVPLIQNGVQYDWALVANATLADIMRKLFEKNITPDNLNRINELEARWQGELSNGLAQDVIERSVSFGRNASQSVFEYSVMDGGHESYLNPFQTPYTWPTMNGAWKPTGAVPNPLAPRWMNCRPFMMENLLEAQPTVHPVYSTDPNSEFYKAAKEVYDIVRNASSEQKEIARFWADDPFNTCTPTGHTFNILTQLLEEHDADLGYSAVAYARLAIGENDAFIACWKTKYDYFLIRPVSYIKENIDPTFTTVIGTPPFPAYTSGHATESAVGSRIFTDLFTNGDGFYPFTDRTQMQFGFSVRNFDNFNKMAEECANSRLYGGIHYDFDNQNGLKMGRAIGDNVNKRLDWPDIQ